MANRIEERMMADMDVVLREKQSSSARRFVDAGAL